MKVVAIGGERRARLVEREDPFPKGEFVVVRVEVAPMCTEFKAWKAGSPGDRLGHEAAGTVEAVEGSRRVRVGERVVVMPQYPCGRCRLCLAGDFVYCTRSVDPLALTGNAAGTATYAQRLIKQDWMLVPVPDEMPLAHAAMANCALGPGYGAARLAEVSGDDTVLVTGLGPVGLGAVLVAKRRGARVAAVEGSPTRAELGRRLGADLVLDPADPDAPAQLRAWTEFVDVALECAGAPAAQRFAIDALRRRGTLVFVGEAGALTTHVSDDFIRKGLRAIGSWYYNLADTRPLMDLIGRIPEEIEALITHRFPMREVETAFALQEKGACGKVLLEPWG